MAENYSDDRLEQILEEVETWREEFSESSHFQGLTEDQRLDAEFIISKFAEFMYSYYGQGPAQWKEREVEDCCLYTFPMKVSGEEGLFENIAPVLSAFFDFLHEKELLKDASKLAARVLEIRDKIVENSNNPENWGFAKLLVMTAKNMGVDVTDKEEMSKFIRSINKQINKGRKATGKKKVGRNDPCPCGSGKKYKKCCGRPQ